MRLRSLVGFLAPLALAWPAYAVGSKDTAKNTFQHDPLHSTEVLYSSNIAYCSPPGPIILSSLDLKFFRKTHVLEFDVQASSTVGDGRFDIDAELFVYGRKYVKIHQDLCSIADQTLCPIPRYNFSGSSSVTVPDEYVNQAPRIAFNVPDLEVLGVVQVFDRNTTQLRGCIQVQFSNAKTTDLPGITYGLAAFVIASVVASLATSAFASSLSPLQWRVVDVVTTMQLTPFVSMLTLIMPRVVHSFSRRFAWLIGLAKIDQVDESIVQSRRNTGSDDVHIVSGPLMEAEYVRLANYFPAAVLNRNASAQLIDVNDVSALDLHALTKRKLYAPNTGPGGEMNPGNEENNVVWAINLDGWSQAGAFFYISSLGISPYSAFLTSLVIWLIVVCIAIGLGLIAFAAVSLVVYIRHRFMHAAMHRVYFQWVQPMLLRVYECATPPLLTLAFFQFAHSTSWMSHLVAGVTVAVIAGGWVAVLVRQLGQVQRHGAESLYYFTTWPSDSRSAAMRLGTMSHPWRPRYWWFWVIGHLCVFLRACFVAFPQKHDYGLRQSVGLLVMDVLFFAVLVVCRPAIDVQNNIVQCVLGAFRIAIWVLCVALTTDANVWGIPRAVVGFVLLALLCLAIVFLFFVFLIEILQSLFARWQRWHALSDRDADVSNDSDDSSVEKKEN